MSASLRNFWYTAGYIAEGRGELERAIAMSDGRPTADLAVIFYAAAQFARLQDDPSAERTFYHRSLETARKLEGRVEDKKALSLALRGMSHLAGYDNDYELARQCSEERLAIHKALGDEDGIASALYSMGTVAFHTLDFALARRLLEESLELSLKTGAKGIIGATYVNLGETARAQGDYAAARSFYEESLKVWRAMGTKRGASVSCRSLGHLTLAEGNPEGALEYFTRSLTFHHELRERSGVGQCLVGFSQVWSAQGYPEPAAILSGSAETLMAESTTDIDHIEKQSYALTLAELRSKLGEEAFLAALKAGAAMSMDEAVAFALNSAPAVGSPDRRMPTPSEL